MNRRHDDAAHSDALWSLVFATIAALAFYAYAGGPR